jgi:hypothetical protein
MSCGYCAKRRELSIKTPFFCGQPVYNVDEYGKIAYLIESYVNEGGSILNIFNALSSLLKYLFVTIIYLFIFGIIRMIFLDIRRLDPRRKNAKVYKNVPYLELLSDKSKLYFDVRSSYPLDADRVVIGRGAECDIAIDDLYLSTKHTQLWFEDDEWYIADMGSKNGTYVNGTRMDKEPLILDSGDKIRLGQVEFMIVDNS